MTVDDEDSAQQKADSVDHELNDAIEILRQLPQTEAAAGVGMTVRRYREIEHGRVSNPHKSTREAIIRFADSVRTRRWTRAEHTASYAPVSVTQPEQDEGGFPWAGLMIGGLFLLAIIGSAIGGQNPKTFMWPPGRSPD